MLTEIKFMNSIKIATALILSTGLLVGCNTDLRDEIKVENTSPLTGGYWQINGQEEDNVLTKSNDLPNVYFFDGTNQKYYNDDDNSGTYTIYPSSFTDDIDTSKITFNYYENSSNAVEVTGQYNVTSGKLTISETNLGELSGVDYSTDDLVMRAIASANNEAGNNNVVHILDTNNLGEKEDTGELRIKLSESATVSEIASGKLTVDIIYQLDSDTTQEADGTSDNAYISLYAKQTSTSGLHGEIAFEKGTIKYRDASKALTDAGGTFKLGEPLSIEVSWEPDSFSFSVNGVEYVSGESVTDGSAVTTVALRLGANSDTTNYEILGDNLVVYSNDSGSETIVFEDNFDSHTSGLDLSTLYNNNSNEATVLNTISIKNQIDTF